MAGFIAASKRCEQRNEAPPRQTIHLKIGVRRKNSWRRNPLHHAHKAGISQRHRHIALSLDQCPDCINLVTYFKLRDEHAFLHERKQRVWIDIASAKKMPSFGQYRLARHQRICQLGHAFFGPRMMPISSVQVRDQRTRISDDSFPHRPKSSR
jgi:hypothetical protein